MRHMSYHQYARTPRGLSYVARYNQPLGAVAPMVHAGLGGLGVVRQTEQGVIMEGPDMMMAMMQAPLMSGLLGAALGGLFGGSWKAAGTGALVGATVGEGSIALSLWMISADPAAAGMHPTTGKLASTYRWLASAATLGLGYWTYRRFRTKRRR